MCHCPILRGPRRGSTPRRIKSASPGRSRHWQNEQPTCDWTENGSFERLNERTKKAGAGEATLVARSLRKTYGDFEAVKGVDFEVYRGECFGFLGPNGAGKTT